MNFFECAIYGALHGKLLSKIFSDFTRVVLLMTPTYGYCYIFETISSSHWRRSELLSSDFSYDKRDWPSLQDIWLSGDIWPLALVVAIGFYIVPHLMAHGCFDAPSATRNFDASVPVDGLSLSSNVNLYAYCPRVLTCLATRLFESFLRTCVWVDYSWILDMRGS